MIEKLIEQVEGRFADLQRQMSDPEVIGDRERYAAVGREFSELESAHSLALEWRRLRDDLEGARELLDEGGEDEELRQVVADAPARLEELEDEIRLAMVERDPNDAKNVIIEIRAGTGGDEAALFAGDLYKMLTRYAEERGFSVEDLSLSAAEVGGFKDATFEIKGDGAYSVFKFEGGTHRVQRVPKTESQGRIHTSTATVAVLPEAEDVEVEIAPDDLQVDVYRSSGPGGQSVNTTDSAVRLTHKPIGIVVSMQDEKSQLQNRDKAMRVMRARLYERALAEQQQALAAERRSQVGTGERSEKIRTYNFPQGRVTDHRVKLTAHNLDEILGGHLSEFTSSLAAEEKRARLEAQTNARAPTPRRAERGGGGRRDGRRGAELGGRRAPRRRRRLARARRRAAARGGERSSGGLASSPTRARASIAAAAREFGAFVRRRVMREPVAYILGRRGFRRLELAVDRRVLIPRPETELAGRGGARAAGGPEVIPGRRRRHRLGGDRARRRRRAARGARSSPSTRSLDALVVAKANAERLGLASRVRLVHGDGAAGRVASTSSSPTFPT